ncbi:MAG: SDR family oxidoreductase [Mesorhizobium sp.]|nr:SDR family oxidoreductase [Mesorhizobium sp.]
MSGSLEDRVAIVTGAGSLPGRGIGRGIVGSLCSYGAKVLAVDIDETTAGATAEHYRAMGHEVVSFRADVTNRDDLHAMVERAISAFGRLDVLVNHAGFGSFMALTETDDEHWDKMIALNLTSVFIASREAVPHMMKNETGGVIINTISSAGIAGARAGLGYTAAKHGVVGLTRNIATTYASRGIRCVGVCPGYTRSPLPEGMKPQIAHTDSTDEAGALLGQMAGLSFRNGKPNELSDVIGFLATDTASFINGAIIPVDGGWTAL